MFWDNTCLCYTNSVYQRVKLSSFYTSSLLTFLICKYKMKLIQEILSDIGVFLYPGLEGAKKNDSIKAVVTKEVTRISAMVPGEILLQEIREQNLNRCYRDICRCCCGNRQLSSAQGFHLKAGEKIINICKIN